MKVIADTSGVIALLDATDKHHASIRTLAFNLDLLIPTTILPEVDYLATKYLGEIVARTFVEDLSEGAFTYLPIEPADLRPIHSIMSRYADIPIGLVDASLVALADRHGVQSILTLDRRHFSIIRSERFEYWNLLP